MEEKAADQKLKFPKLCVVHLWFTPNLAFHRRDMGANACVNFSKITPLERGKGNDLGSFEVTHNLYKSLGSPDHSPFPL